MVTAADTQELMDLITYWCLLMINNAQWGCMEPRQRGLSDFISLFRNIISNRTKKSILFHRSHSIPLGEIWIYTSIKNGKIFGPILLIWPGSNNSIRWDWNAYWKRHSFPGPFHRLSINLGWMGLKIGPFLTKFNRFHSSISGYLPQLKMATFLGPIVPIFGPKSAKWVHKSVKIWPGSNDSIRWDSNFSTY